MKNLIILAKELIVAYIATYFMSHFVQPALQPSECGTWEYIVTTYICMVILAFLVDLIILGILHPAPKKHNRVQLKSARQDAALKALHRSDAESQKQLAREVYTNLTDPETIKFFEDRHKEIFEGFGQFDSDIMLHAHKCKTLSASHEK